MDIIIEPGNGNQRIELLLDPVLGIEQDISLFIPSPGGVNQAIELEGNASVYDQEIELLIESQRENISLLIEQTASMKPEALYKIEMIDVNSFPEVRETFDGEHTVYTFKIPRMTEEMVFNDITEELDVGNLVALFENRLM